MKKIVFLTLFLVLAYGGYKYIQAVVNFERLSNKIDLIISEPQSKAVESIEKAILTKAAELKIPLSREDIDITVRDTERVSLGERFIARPEIEVESRLLTVRFSYSVKIYGITKTFSYNIEKVFTSKASLIVPDIEERTK